MYLMKRDRLQRSKNNIAVKKKQNPQILPKTSNWTRLRLNVANRCRILKIEIKRKAPRLITINPSHRTKRKKILMIVGDNQLNLSKKRNKRKNQRVTLHQH